MKPTLLPIIVPVHTLPLSIHDTEDFVERDVVPSDLLRSGGESIISAGHCCISPGKRVPYARWRFIQADAHRVDVVLVARTRVDCKVLRE